MTSSLPIWLVLLSLVIGCGAGESATERMDTQSAFDAAEAAFAQKDYSQADKLYDDALQGPLNPDLLGEAYRKRAICLAHQKEFGQALQILSKGEQGLGEDEYFGTQGEIFTLKGDATAAQEAFAKAKKANPRYQVPKVK